MNIHSQANESRKNIMNLVRTLSSYYVGRNRKQADTTGFEKDEIIFLLNIAMVAREPMLILGEPGTAKSDMIIRFSEACGAKKYFEHMLTMFTEPSEILGPVDINALKAGNYQRILEGRIADAEIVFLDEIFKGNSAVLNTLLTLMNEHKIYQGKQVVYLPDNILLGFFAASNQIPDNAEILALKDRFPIKVRLERTPEDQFFDLVQVGVQNDIDRNRRIKPWENQCSLEDFLIVRNYFFEQLGHGASADATDEKSRFRFSTSMDALFRRIILTLRNELKIQISDRQVIKLYRLVATRAFLERGAFPRDVEPKDMVMLCYTAEWMEDFKSVYRYVNQMIGG
ncbi:MAG: AAA domain-containing protein [Proteobacteria bacterium]|nr:AAA domain-containing protein [Pseudomonadota bacterium]